MQKHFTNEIDRIRECDEGEEEKTRDEIGVGSFYGVQKYTIKFRLIGDPD